MAQGFVRDLNLIESDTGVLDRDWKFQRLLQQELEQIMGRQTYSMPSHLENRLIILTLSWEYIFIREVEFR